MITAEWIVQAKAHANNIGAFVIFVHSDGLHVRPPFVNWSFVIPYSEVENCSSPESLGNLIHTYVEAYLSPLEKMSERERVEAMKEQIKSK